MKLTVTILTVMFLVIMIVVVKSFDKVNEIYYTCEVKTIDTNYMISTRNGSFSSTELNKIEKFGGAMLGTHVPFLTKTSEGLYLYNTALHTNGKLAEIVFCKNF